MTNSDELDKLPSECCTPEEFLLELEELLEAGEYDEALTLVKDHLNNRSCK